MDNPTVEKIMDKIRKLLRLAERAGTPGEAAAAASAAQRLQAEYRIEALALEDAAPATAEKISDAALNPGDMPGHVATWRNILANVVAKANGCKLYLHPRRTGKVMHVVGRASDQAAVRELFSWLAVSIDRLAVRHCAGRGATYFNNFRIGCVDTLAQKLAEDIKAREETMRATEAGRGAIVLVKRADDELGRWLRENLKLRSGSRSSFQHDDGAREAGRQAGQSLDPTRRAKLSNARLLGAAS